MTLIYGFAGMRDNQGEIHFAPRVPDQLGNLQVPLEIRGQRLEVALTTTSATYIVRGEESEGVKLWQFGKNTYLDFLSLADDDDIGEDVDN